MSIHKNDNFYSLSFVLRPDHTVKACCCLEPGIKALLVLQCSGDGLHFHNVDNVYASGDTDLPVVYSLSDKASGQAVMFYRLRFVFSDGTFFTTDHEVVRSEEQVMGVSVTPRVFPGNEIKMKVYNAPEIGNMLVVIYDSLGNEISSFFKKIREAGEQVLKCQVPDQLRSGVYKVVSSFSTGIFESTFLVK